MIIQFLFYLLSIILLVLSNILPIWQPWPTPLHDFLFWLVDQTSVLGIIFNVPACLEALGWFINVLSMYLFARLIVSIINWARGTGGIEI